MNLIQMLLNSPLMLRKGEGIYRLDPETGEPVFIGMPTPEMFHDDKKNPLQGKFDLPLHAHLGDKTPGGKWIIGAHGEMVWEDDFGHQHRHGIDGLAKQLASLGVKDPIAVINEAIKMTNDSHDLGEAGHMPFFNDPAWRKLNFHSYSTSEDVDAARGYPYNGAQGSLATVNMSSAPKASKSGTKMSQFPESYRIGFAPILRTVLEAVGIDIPDFLEGVTHPYISGNFLSNGADGSQIVKRLRSQFGEELNPDMTLPHDFASKIGATTNTVPPFQEGVHTWEMMHTLPKVINHPNLMAHYKAQAGKGPGGRKGSIKNYKEYLEGLAPFMLKHTDPEILDIPLVAGNPPTTLKTALTQDTEMLVLINAMMKSPGAMSFLLGQPDNKGPAKWLLDNLQQQLLDVMTPEEKMGYQNSLKGITAGETESAGDKHGHALAASLFALAHHVDPEGISNFGMEGLPEAEQEYVEQQDRIFDVVAHSLSQAHGHQPNRGLTVSDEIPDYQQVTMPKLLQQHQELAGALPPHIQERLISELNEMPQPMSMGEGVPDDAQEHKDLWQMAPQLTTEQQQKIYQIMQGSYPERGIPQQLLDTMRESDLSPFAQNQRFAQQEGLDEQAALARYLQTMRQNVGSTQQSLPITTSFDTVSLEDRLVKAMERLQMLDAKKDVAVLKRVPRIPVKVENEDDVSYLAMSLGITKQDVRAIAHSKGDWHRVAKAYDFNPVVVKAVKVSLGGT